MKNKKVAIVLALTLGIVGGHRFYLGQSGKGLIYLFLSLTLVPLMIGVIDALIWTLNSQDSFDNKYNKVSIQREILKAIKNK